MRTEDEMYSLILKISEEDERIRAVFKMTEFFSIIAKFVEEELGYSYNSKEERACMEFLNIVYALPKDAKEIM